MRVTDLECRAEYFCIYPKDRQAGAPSRGLPPQNDTANPSMVITAGVLGVVPLAAWP